MNQNTTGGVRCHDADTCAMGQKPCPTPNACGIDVKPEEAEIAQLKALLKFADARINSLVDQLAAQAKQGEQS